MCLSALESEAGSDGVGALEVLGGTVGVVNSETGLLILGEGDVDRGTGTDAIAGGGGTAAPHALLEDVAGTELEFLQQAVFETESVVVTQESVGGEGTCNGESLIPFVEQKVVGETDI